MKFFLVLILGFSLFSSACSTKTKQTAVAEENTLRYEIQNLYTDWTVPVEENILNEKSKKRQNIVQSVRITPAAIAVAKQSKVLYPFLEGFGLVDTRDISAEAKKTLDDFCRSIIEEKTPWELAEKDREYVLMFFAKDYSDFINSRSETVSDFFYGKPVLRENTLLVPVRFCGKKQNFDFTVYLVNDSNWHIRQIQLKEV